MDRNDPMITGINKLGENPKADLYALFDAIRLQLAQLRGIASRDLGPEANDARKDISHFIAKLEENGLWDALVKIRDSAITMEDKTQ
jgi:hypothetical protein